MSEQIYLDIVAQNPGTNPSDHMHKFLKTDNKLTNKLISTYLQQHSVYIGISSKFIRNIEKILDQIELSEENLILLSDSINCRHGLKLITLLKNKKIKIIPQMLYKIILRYHHKKELLAYFLENGIPDSNILEISCKHSSLTEYIKILINKNIPITEQTVIFAASNQPGEIIDLLLIKFIPDIGCLEKVCQRSNILTIQKILQFKIIPNKTCFKNLCIGPILYYPFGNEYIKESTANKIDLLIQHGYKISCDDIIIALQNKCCINNISRFELTEQEKNKISDLCYKLNYFPYSDIINNTPSLQILQELCGESAKINLIKKIISKGIKPDQVCLQNSCKVKSNLATTRYLVQNHDLKIDIQCLKNHVESYGNQTTKFIFDLYTKN